ncbi:anhydro-N-acetylmuramic acid kinase [Marivirga lumbricoides]
MSGTSLDGLDIAYCKFEKTDDKWSYEIVEAETITYPTDISNYLKEGITLSGIKLRTIDLKLGYWMGEQVKVFKNKYLVRAQFVASHGHTIFHQPENNLSLQIGDLNALHAASELPVIGDFRTLDIMKGGQGAPLVPAGDQLLFSEFEICLNLGGIANLSYYTEKGNRIAYDVSVCNLLLNKLASSEGFDYDEDGKMAASGTPNEDFLKQLNTINYYKHAAPKSLGLEQIEAEVFPLFRKSSESTSNMLATAVEHIAEQIARCIKSHIKEGKVLITGGGARNSFLMKRLQQKLGTTIQVAEVPNKLIDYKEALIFAFLGVLKLRNETNVFSSVTGATSDSISGVQVGKFSI